MSEAILVALIPAVLSLVGVIYATRKSTAEIAAKFQQQSREADAKLEKAQAVTDTKLDELTREVRRHNNFAEKIPVLEEKIKVANNRIADLERGKNHE